MSRTTDLLDARGFKRSLATLPGHNAGRPPRNKGRRYPADPPTAAETVALMRACPDDAHGHRLSALIVVLWRSALRVSEALALLESDLSPATGGIVVRQGKGGKRRTAGMDPWGWEQLAAWLTEREAYPIGPVFCVLEGPTAGTRAWSDMQVRSELRRLRERAEIRRRIAPHQWRHAWALERLREGTPLPVIQRQLGHSNLGVTSVYMAGMSSDEVLEHASNRSAPTLSVPDLMEAFRVD